MASPLASRFSFISPQQISQIKDEFAPLGSGGFDLQLDHETGIALLAIDHYERRNSFSGCMIAQFDEVIDRLEQWKQGKAVIIYGKGGFFSSGADLDTVRRIGYDSVSGKKMNIIMQHNLLRLQHLPLITVAFIEGKAIGGGAEFCTACDFRVIAEDAEIGFVQIKMGITTGFGGGCRLVNLVGTSRALDLLVSGRRLSAKECSAINLVNHTVTRTSEAAVEGGDSPLDKCITWVKEIISSSGAEPIQAAKKIVTAASTLSFSKALEEEMNIFTSIWGKESHMAAMAANVKHK